MAGADKKKTIVTDDEFVVAVEKAKQDASGSISWDAPKEKRFKLDQRRANTLWAEIDRLRIFEWRDSYSPEDVGTEVNDGTYWSVSIEVAGRSKESSGTNTYPLLDPFAAPTVDLMKPTAFNKLRALLRLLEEEANQSPEPMPLKRHGSS